MKCLEVTQSFNISPKEGEGHYSCIWYHNKATGNIFWKEIFKHSYSIQQKYKKDHCDVLFQHFSILPMAPSSRIIYFCLVLPSHWRRAIKTDPILQQFPVSSVTRSPSQDFEVNCYALSPTLQLNFLATQYFVSNRDTVAPGPSHSAAGCPFTSLLNLLCVLHFLPFL